MTHLHSLSGSESNNIFPMFRSSDFLTSQTILYVLIFLRDKNSNDRNFVLIFERDWICLLLVLYVLVHLVHRWMMNPWGLYTCVVGNFELSFSPLTWEYIHHKTCRFFINDRWVFPFFLQGEVNFKLICFVGFSYSICHSMKRPL